MKSEFAPCPVCGELLEHGLPDPQLLGRSMQRCSNRACENRHLHAMPIRDLRPRDKKGFLIVAPPKRPILSLHLLGQ